MYGETSGSFATSLGATQYGTHGSEDLFLFDFNNQNNPPWFAQLGNGDSIFVPLAVLSDSSDNVYAFGNAQSGTSNFGGGTLYGTRGAGRFPGHWKKRAAQER